MTQISRIFIQNTTRHFVVNLCVIDLCVILVSAVMQFQTTSLSGATRFGTLYELVQHHFKKPGYLVMCKESLKGMIYQNKGAEADNSRG